MHGVGGKVGMRKVPTATPRGCGKWWQRRCNAGPKGPSKGPQDDYLDPRALRALSRLPSDTAARAKRLPLDTTDRAK